jgi:hypothetical protein
MSRIQYILFIVLLPAYVVSQNNKVLPARFFVEINQDQITEAANMIFSPVTFKAKGDDEFCKTIDDHFFAGIFFLKIMDEGALRYLSYTNKQKVFSLNLRSNVKQSKAGFNIGLIDTSNALCNSMNEYKVPVKDVDQKEIKSFFREMVSNYFVKSTENSQLNEWYLLKIPMLNDNNNNYNIKIRKFLHEQGLPILARVFFVLWHKSAINDLPECFQGADYKIIPLFTNQHEIKRTNNTGNIKDGKGPCVKINFSGNIKDSLLISYYLKGKYISEKDQLKPYFQELNNKQLIIQLPGQASDNDLYSLKIVPPKGYYVVENKGKYLYQRMGADCKLFITKKDSIRTVKADKPNKLYFIYLDAGEMNEKLIVADILKKELAKIRKEKADFFILLSNSNKPYYSSDYKGYNEIISRVMTQLTENGINLKNWEVIEKSLPADELNYLQRHGMLNIQFFLSETVYRIYGEDIIRIFENKYVRGGAWKITIYTNFKIHKKLKPQNKTGTLIIDYVNINEIK